MKYLNFLAIALIVSLSSCGGGSSEDANSEDQVDSTASEAAASPQRGMVEVDLNEFYVNATIMVPDESRGEQNIAMNDFGETRIQVGTIYDVIIAEQIEGDLNTFIQALSEDITYSNEVIEQGDDFVLYKSSIVDSHIDPEFHFFAIKTADGIVYEIHDYNEEGGYAESVARLMLESVNNMKANNTAS
ncbi:hypothetical protein N8911_02115 [bacterium]|nr:hypothetical protein [bacterium]MDC1212064.1 hypothetical protein [bacterium]